MRLQQLTCLTPLSLLVNAVTNSEWLMLLDAGYRMVQAVVDYYDQAGGADRRAGASRPRPVASRRPTAPSLALVGLLCFFNGLSWEPGQRCNGE